ncbi:GNAT family N-acetyltransferase [Geosporobacter ferrireducens]|uniref:GNAT family N-acetyltransferase n=1 Tax=Geosporobacter ferrireducens TaxID=1424294 RepID=A0A1D8GHH7_9FIRM|nr:GNAT family N-acetyltransferase [Geosporobacter ferrireducens]AOT70373.1 GNAT family N-acetyltransferase [Geosporobacter ferrireducens]MTI54348.1 GNAT family N-acetyltransferase [Geosporobacter ferrireducens]
MQYITLNKSNIDSEHICCAFSDKKCSEGYELKKKWLRRAFDNGYIFRKLDERAKVFIEYGPAEKAWVPVAAPNYIMVNCFWVSGKYKENGHGKALLQQAMDDAAAQGKDGLVTVVGTQKYHFMSDGKWLLRQGFEICESIPSGFSLLVKNMNRKGISPVFNESVKTGECPEKNGYVVYYSNRCPYSEYHVKNSLVETAAKRGLSLKIIKLESMEQAQSAPSPATIFSLFHEGKFVTTDISVCMDSRFDKIMGKNK